MKFRLVNDDKLQIIISKEDMAQRELQKWDLAPNNPEAQQLFHEILEEAREACGFDVGNNAQLMIEAYPMTGESMLLTVTKMNGKHKPHLPFGLDMESIGQALMDELMQQEEALPDVAMEELVYRFDTLEDVIQAAQLMRGAYEGASQLIRYEEAYYLILLEKEWASDRGMAVLSEFGEEILTAAAFFQEHGQMAMAEHAIEILASL